jgi:hypothetical protein
MNPVNFEENSELNLLIQKELEEIKPRAPKNRAERRKLGKINRRKK